MHNGYVGIWVRSIRVAGDERNGKPKWRVTGNARTIQSFYIPAKFLKILLAQLIRIIKFPIRMQSTYKSDKINKNKRNSRHMQID